MRPSTALHTTKKIPLTRVMSTINREHLGSPGPGMYNASQLQSSSNAKNSVIGFGTSKRANNFTSKEDMPGPGNYNVRSLKGTTPTYKIGIKLKA